MKILANYLYAHLKSLSFFVAFVFFAMDMSSILGGWGYVIYYPMLFLTACYCLKYNRQISISTSSK